LYRELIHGFVSDNRVSEMNSRGGGDKFERTALQLEADAWALLQALVAYVLIIQPI
jgi:hypothetical protein